MSGMLAVWGHAFWRLLFPPRCVVCGTLLGEGEEGICMKCNMVMPRTNFHRQADNSVEQMFWGRFRLERATSYFFYQKGSAFRNILYQLKYYGRQNLGRVMGRFVAAELALSDFFAGIDMIVPVPLHPRRQLMRGYNQSQRIAEGLSAVTGIPVNTGLVVRIRNTQTQTHKSSYERWENMEGVFSLLRPQLFAGKHILIVDDVLTTGATVTACADAFAGVEGIRISVLTLAVTG